MIDVGEELRNLQLSLHESDDKPIFYISRSFGHKYIVPRHIYEKLERENLKMKKILEIIFEKNVDIKQLKHYIEIHSDDIALKTYNDFHNKDEELTQGEFNLLKRWVECQKN